MHCSWMSLPEMSLEIHKCKTWRHSPLIVLTTTCFYRIGDLTMENFNIIIQILFSSWRGFCMINHYIYRQDFFHLHEKNKPGEKFWPSSPCQQSKQVKTLVLLSSSYLFFIQLLELVSDTLTVIERMRNKKREVKPFVQLQSNLTGASRTF